MTAYVDSSVFLRVLLNQKGRLKEFKLIKKPIGSLLLKVEVLRTIDRLRVGGMLSEREFVALTSQAYSGLSSVELIRPTESILSGAGAALPLPLGTLDAIHLVSAITWRNARKEDLVFLTHDELLGKAALASGFDVLGCM
jgi:predicted nucleic acid-binding protein